MYGYIAHIFHLNIKMTEQSLKLTDPALFL